MAQAFCKQCGAAFQRDDGQEWKLLCLDCWRARKRQERAREAELQQEVEQLRRSLANAQRKAALVKPQLDRRFIKRIVSLTHPDKHGGSETATEVTQQLLAIMRQPQDNSRAW